MMLVCFELEAPATTNIESYLQAVSQKKANSPTNAEDNGLLLNPKRHHDVFRTRKLLSLANRDTIPDW